MTNQNALIIFIKNPQLGKVKTRLAKTVGDEKALEIYLKLVEITRKNTSKLAKTGVQCYLFYSDYINANDDWAHDIFIKNVQMGDDLGARMHNAFTYVLSKHQCACIIGSDCPTLSIPILKKAFKTLENKDSVIGIATDGGYYLLGLKTMLHTPLDYAYLFENMEWSVETVAEETMKRLENNQKTYTLLPSLTDIDEEKDWVDYMGRA
jgi:uncharacterized protein